MRAEILDEDDETGRIGVRVVDPEGVDHRIAVEFDGTIRGHGQDGYPDDPADRTPVEAERVEQARRYARHHVYRSRGYDTLPAGENPDRIGGVLLAVHGASGGTFEEYLGELHAQLAAGHVEGLARPVELPPAARRAPTLVFERDVYLRADLRAIERRVARRLPAVLGGLSDVFEGSPAGDVSLNDVFAAVDPRRAVGFDPGVGEGGPEIDGVSGIRVRYPTEEGWTTVRRDRPDGRAADATVQLEPGGLEDVDTFRLVVTHHLVCQIRDCYLGMGVDPPESARVVGRGLWKYTTRYDRLDCYENYHDYRADVEGYDSMF